MSNQPKFGAVLFGQDLSRLADFYRRAAALTVVIEEDDHVVLESSAFQLVVHAIPRHIAETIEVASPPVLREESPVKLAFPVGSLAEARIEAHAAGGGMKGEASEWEWRGFRACDGHDPEGNVVQFREAALAR